MNLGCRSALTERVTKWLAEKKIAHEATRACPDRHGLTSVDLNPVGRKERLLEPSRPG
jgi:hypothetical protein